jgi:hypothetical protein
VEQGRAPFSPLPAKRACQDPGESQFQLEEGQNGGWGFTVRLDEQNLIIPGSEQAFRIASPVHTAEGNNEGFDEEARLGTDGWKVV